MSTESRRVNKIDTAMSAVLIAFRLNARWTGVGLSTKNSLLSSVHNPYRKLLHYGTLSACFAYQN